jgi:phosphoribosylformylglycinamidine cyclo-ligase
MVESIAAGCRIANCALIGGETAEMPDIYGKDEYDLAGFSVGVVERDRIITGKHVQQGDIVLGLASSGIHSNGYTLVRHICFKKEKLDIHATFNELGDASLSEILLEPTRIYVRSIVGLLNGYKRRRSFTRWRISPAAVWSGIFRAYCHRLRCRAENFFVESPGHL